MEFVIEAMRRRCDQLSWLLLALVISSTTVIADGYEETAIISEDTVTECHKEYDKAIGSENMLTKDPVEDKASIVPAEVETDNEHDGYNAEVSEVKATNSQDDAELKIRELDARSKRQINTLPLVFPYGGTYRLIIGFTTPVHNPDNINFVLLCSILYQYVQFANITQLSQYYSYNTISREQRDAEWESRKDERLVFYRALEDMMNSKGLNGHDCVLRAICEAAQFPVKDEGLVGELMHIILTPNYGRTEFQRADHDWEAAMSPYLSAYEAGRQMFSCNFIYSLCPQGTGLLDLVTVLRNE